MRNFGRILSIAVLLSFAAALAHAQHGQRFRGPGSDSSWSLRWHPRIGSHFGLRESCWNAFLSELQTDTAQKLNSTISSIRATRGKIDSLHKDYHAAMLAGDTTLGRLTWVRITDLFGTIDNDWKMVKPTIRQNRDRITRLRHDCPATAENSVTGLVITPVIPNPSTANASFSYTLNSTGNVLIQISDQRGNVVKTVFNGSSDAGKHDIRLDLGGLRSGAYLLRLQAGSDVNTEKFVISN